MNYPRDGLVPVATPSSQVIHALDMGTNPKWVDGEQGQTVCKRKTDWYLAGDVEPGDRPCKKCDEVAPVLALMFHASQVTREEQSVPVGAHDHEHDHDHDHDHEMHHDPHAHLMDQYGFMTWLQAGMRSGYISPPACFPHFGIMELPEESEHREMGHDICLFYVRLFPR